MTASRRQVSSSVIRLSTSALSAWSLTGAVSRHLPFSRRSSIRSSPFWIVIPSSFSRSKLTTLPAWRCASSVFGFLLSKNLIQTPRPIASRRRMSVVRVFIPYSLGATAPPNERSEQPRDQRDQHQNYPAQFAQGRFIEGEGKSLRNLGRNPNHLFPAEQPVAGRRNEIELLLILSQCIVLNEG